MRNFDPIITSVPATITELVTSERHLHIDGFDFTVIATVETTGTTGDGIIHNGTPAGGGEGSNEETDCNGIHGGGGKELKGTASEMDSQSPTSGEQRVVDDT